MNENLPIFQYKNRILEAVLSHDTVIVTGETGSGKSTQVPQFLLEAGLSCTVTEPRRIACMTLAERVEEETGGQGIAAYETAFETNARGGERIVFSTDGLVMARGVSGFSGDRVLIIDEIHEWNLNVETLAAWVRHFRERGGKIRLIVMSATIDAGRLREFYGPDAVHIDVPGRLFAVEMIHEEDMDGSAYIEAIRKCVSEGKSVLAFRPGKREISGTIAALEEAIPQGAAMILPMHADLPMDGQMACFAEYDVPKVVVSTNISQTSVTIPGIHAVVDDGLEKRVVASGGIESLETHDISVSDIRQRAGRAGRVQIGEYHLCSMAPIDGREADSTPEIGRLLLDQVVLRLCAAGIDPRRIRFFHQPDGAAIDEAFATLELLGAIRDGQITEEGLKLSGYPVSVRSARMLEAARGFGFLDDMCKIVAILESGTLLNFWDAETNSRTYAGYGMFTKERRSDLLAELDIFDRFAETEIEELPKTVSQKSMSRAREMHEKLRDFLKAEGTGAKRRYGDFLKCIYAGNPDRVFADDFGERCGIDGNEYQIARESQVERTDIVLGFPKTIKFLNRFGEERSIDLIANVSSIPRELAGTLLDDSLVSVVEMNAWHSLEDGEFHIEEEILYMESVRIGWREREFHAGGPGFMDCARRHPYEYLHPCDYDLWRSPAGRKGIERFPGSEKRDPSMIMADGKFDLDAWKGMHLESRAVRVGEKEFPLVPIHNNYRVFLESESDIPNSALLDELGRPIIFSYKMKIEDADPEKLRVRVAFIRIDEENRRIQQEHKEQIQIGTLGKLVPLMDRIGMFSYASIRKEPKVKYYGLKMARNDVVLTKIHKDGESWKNATGKCIVALAERCAKMNGLPGENGKEIVDMAKAVANALNPLDMAGTRKDIDRLISRAGQMKAALA